MADVELDFIPPPSQAGKQAKEGGSKPKDTGGLTIVQLEKALAANFEMLGIAVMGFDHFDGEVIVSKAPDLASALTEVAKHNKRVRNVLESMVAVGAWGGVLTILGGQIALPMAVHHNLLPDNVNSFLAEQSDIPVKESKAKPKETNLRAVPNDDFDGTEPSH